MWPDLANLGLWWAEYPTSSIAVERNFAQMRLIGVPQRGNMLTATFNRELCFRCNKEVVEDLLKKAVKLM